MIPQMDIFFKSSNNISISISDFSFVIAAKDASLYECHSDVCAPATNAYAHDQQSTAECGESNAIAARAADNTAKGQFDASDDGGECERECTDVHRTAESGAKSAALLAEHIDQSNCSIVARPNDRCLGADGTLANRSGRH